MKQVYLVVLTVLFVFTACDSGITEEVESAKDSFDKSAQEKIWVCHVDSETGDVVLLSVSGNSNHLGNPNHAYGNIEDYVPVLSIDNEGDAKADADGNGVADGCETETLWAVAYIDVNASDGSYHPGVDILIAKLVDNGDGVIGSGDQVITNKYPLDFDLTNGTGDFTRTTHIVEKKLLTSANYIIVESEEENIFTFLKAGTGSLKEQYQERSNQYIESIIIDDWRPDYVEYINISNGSPSGPDTYVDLSRVGAGDDAFIDVELYLPE